MQKSTLIASVGIIQMEGWVGILTQLSFFLYLEFDSATQYSLTLSLLGFLAFLTHYMQKTLIFTYFPQNFQYCKG